MRSNINSVLGLIRDAQPKSVCEVGVWEAELSNEVLSQSPSIERYICVDPHKYELNDFYDEDFGQYQCTMGHALKLQSELDQQYEDNLKKLKVYDIVEYYRETGMEAVERFADGELDMVYIDALHLYEPLKQDIRAWLPKLRKGGILAGDDYVPRFSGVIKAVDEVLPNRTIHDRVWWVVK
jgi:hypothetical protein